MDGTLVGLRCPAFAAGINVPGYHWHFLSADHTRGGHVLDCAFGGLTLRLDDLSGLDLALPRGGTFESLDLSGDVSAQVQRVEKAPGQGK
jgi:acetolactate decarboxylase